MDIYLSEDIARFNAWLFPVKLCKFLNNFMIIARDAACHLNLYNKKWPPTRIYVPCLHYPWQTYKVKSNSTIFLYLLFIVCKWCGWKYGMLMKTLYNSGRIILIFLSKMLIMTSKYKRNGKINGYNSILRKPKLYFSFWNMYIIFLINCLKIVN